MSRDHGTNTQTGGVGDLSDSEHREDIGHPVQVVTAMYAITWPGLVADWDLVAAAHSITS